MLLRAPLVYRTNAYWKAGATRRALARLARHYAAEARTRGAETDEANVIAAVRARLRDRGARVPAERPPAIFWVGANFPQDDSGFLQALARVGPVRTFTNADGCYGLQFTGRGGRVRLYDPEVIRRNDAALLRQIESAVRDGAADLLIGQMWANYLSAGALARVRQVGIPVVNIAMDDRLPIHWERRRGVRLGSIGLKDAVDLVLTTAPECCAWYAAEDCPALFWPLASDPDRFKPAPESAKRFDVTFVGNRYGLRGTIVDALAAAGIAVETFGAGWPNGPVDASQAAEIFGSSRIILGVGTIGHNTDLFTLKLRDFDAPMAGALYVTHRNPDLLRLYEEDREIVCYRSIDECIAKIRHYLTHAEARIAVAAAGARRARAEHTWDRRFAYLMQVLGAAWPR
jgi:hypothetical protein